MNRILNYIRLSEEYRRQKELRGQALHRAMEEERDSLQQFEAQALQLRTALEERRQQELSGVDPKLSQRRDDYLQKRRDLAHIGKEIQQKTGVSLPAQSTPKQVDEAKIEAQISRLRAEGISAWMKRMLKIGGFASRRSMAAEALEEIQNAISYCDQQLMVIERAELERRRKVSDKYRGEGEALEERIGAQRRGLRRTLSEKRERAENAVRQVAQSAELLQTKEQLLDAQALAQRLYPGWGAYEPPADMPERILLCEARVEILDENGIAHPHGTPLWVDLDGPNLIILVDDKRSNEEQQAVLCIQQFLARMIMRAPANRFRAFVFDTKMKGGSLGRLITTSTLDSGKTPIELFGENTEYQEVVQSLTYQIKKIRQAMEGKIDLYHYTPGEEEEPIPFQWLVDFDFEGKHDRNFQENLKILFQNAKHCGYSFLFLTDKSGAEALKKLAEETRLSEVLCLDFETMLFQDAIPFQAAEAPSETQIGAYIDAAEQHYKKAARVSNDIQSFYRRHPPKIRDAAQGVWIPVAEDENGRPVELELGTARYAHGFIAGTTGSGKTSLIHTIIMGAVMHYQPDDLELWLVDYKQVEFATYRGNPPPHVKIIGLSKTREFTYSLLEEIKREFERRAELFTAFSVTELKEYRKHKGAPGYIPLPRILLIIDEFHEMSQFVQDDPTYQIMLENTLAEYRALGLTCLLSDQAFSVGIRGLTEKAKMQINLRVAMKQTSIAELKATLEADSSLYSENVKQMMTRMEIGDILIQNHTMVNHMIADVSIRKYRTIFATAEKRNSLFQAVSFLWRGRYEPKDLLYVCSKAQVPWDEKDRADYEKAVPADDRALRLYLGRPTTLAASFALDLKRRAYENIAAVGGEAEQRWQLLAASIRSIQYDDESRVIVFTTPDSDLEYHCADSISKFFVRHKIEALTTYAQWCEKLQELSGAIREKQASPDKVLCVFIGLEQVYRDMEQLAPTPRMGYITPSNLFQSMSGVKKREEPEQPDASKPEEVNAIECLRTIFTEGARYGYFCIAEYSSYKSYSAIVELSKAYNHKFAFKMSNEDCIMYLGKSAFAEKIGKYCAYNDGGNTAQQVLPYLV